jgi:hypothetical protein
MLKSTSAVLPASAAQKVAAAVGPQQLAAAAAAAASAVPDEALADRDFAAWRVRVG